MAQQASKNTVKSNSTLLAKIKPPNGSTSASPVSATRTSCTKLNRFKKSAVPVRLMFFNHDGFWVDFPAEVTSSLKSAFLNRKPIADVLISGYRYLFDFIRMVQTDFDSGNQRSISWIDENGQCFFPKIFIGDDFDLKFNQTIDIDIRVRKRSEEEPEVSSKRPRLEKWPELGRLMSEEEMECRTKDFFMNGIRKIDSDVIITSIRKIEGQARAELARSFDNQIELVKSAPFRDGNANVVSAWYGGSIKDIESVLVCGFSVNSKVCDNDSHGVGVYLSPLESPHVSAKLAEADENGDKHVVLCKVILGRLEQVHAGSTQDCPSNSCFDSGTDNIENPKCYVVWPCNMSKHILPKAVVSFKHSARFLHGQLKGSTVPRYSLEILISKIRNLLPLAKLREVETLYNTFSAGKVSRDLFIKQVRLIAGDNVLLTAIREIRGQ